LCGGIGSEGNPSRFFSTTAHTRADTPELICTTVPPAKSSTGTLSGRGAVLASFRELLAAAPAWKMVSRDAAVHLCPPSAFVTCLEANGDQPAHLAATNIFLLEDGRWRMVHHHAGPLSVPEPRRPSSFVN
jgi:hypothetical protein